MNFLNKITNAKTSTLVALALILPALVFPAIWVSLWVDILVYDLLEVAALSGPFRFADMELYRFLFDVHYGWWGIHMIVFYTLIIVQLLVVVPLCFYVFKVLYGRYRAIEIKLWQFLVTLFLAIFITMFMGEVLYLLFFELGHDGVPVEQVEVNDGSSVDSIFSKGRSRMAYVDDSART